MRPPGDDEEPLELADLPPPPPASAEPFPIPDAERDRRRARRIRFLVAFVVVLLVAAGIGVFTGRGRAVLPEDMQKPAESIADDVERRAAEATGNAYYTFTDDAGTVHIVDSLDKIPEEFRKRAKRKY